MLLSEAEEAPYQGEIPKLRYGEKKTGHKFESIDTVYISASSYDINESYILHM